MSDHAAGPQGHAKDPAAHQDRIHAMTVGHEDPEPTTPTPRARVEDRHGNDLAKGDQVEIVYGGEYHRTTIDSISPIKTQYGLTSGHHTVEATITVKVKAASVLKLHEKKDPVHSAPQSKDSPVSKDPDTHKGAH